MPQGAAGPRLPVVVTLDSSIQDSALPDGTSLLLEPIVGGWLARFDGLFDIEIGFDRWADSSPLGRPLRATGAWHDDTFVADLHVITSPHCVRLTIHADTSIAHACWTTVPLTGPDLRLHLRSPLMTRPDVA